MEEINLLVGEHSILQCRVINQNMDANKIHIKWLINGKSVESQNISSSIKVNLKKIILTFNFSWIKEK